MKVLASEFMLIFEIVTGQTHFVPLVPLYTPEMQQLSVFRGYRKRLLARNRLKLSMFRYESLTDYSATALWQTLIIL